MRRPWIVMGRSHEHEWDGQVGRRFATEERARAFAKKAEEDIGWYDVRVGYFPATLVADYRKTKSEAPG